MGIPATGRTVTWGAVKIDQVENGRIAEEWCQEDVYGLLQQLSQPAAS